MDAALGAWLEGLATGQKMPRAIGQVVSVLKSAPELCAFATANRVAEAAEVNVATVVRTAQFLGFSGWPELALDYRGRYLATLSAGTVLGRPEEAGPAVRGLASVHEDARSLRFLAENLDETAITDTAAAMLGAGRIAVLATGTFSAPAVQLAHNGQLLGLPIDVYSGAPSAQLNAVRQLTHTDLVISFHLWKTSTTVERLTGYAAEMGIPQVVIADRSSRATEEAGVSLIVPTSSSRYLPSTIPVVAAVQAILSDVSYQGGEAVAERLREVDDLWGRFGILND